MTVLSVSVTTDFRQSPFDLLVTGQNVTEVAFGGSGIVSATFNASQFGGSNIANSVLLRGRLSESDTVNVTMASAGDFTAAGWTFANWTAGSDSIQITGSGGNDGIVGSSQRDGLIGGVGNDLLAGEALSQAGLTFGSGSLVRAANTANGTIASALSLDGLWSSSSDAAIGASSVLPHVSVSGSADSLTIRHYYKMTAVAGQIMLFDIDATASHDTVLRLYDPNGVLVATGDDMSTTIGGTGSASSFHSYIAHEAALAGTYTIEVSEYSGTGYDLDRLLATQELRSGVSYTLQVSTSVNPTVGAADTLSGGDGSDTLLGGGGDDVLTGGAGSDVALGGAGNDVFMFGGTDYDGEWIDGGLGVDQLRFTSSVNLPLVTSRPVILSIEELQLDADAQVEISASYFGSDGRIATDAVLKSSGTQDNILSIVLRTGSGVFSAAGFVLDPTWNGGDHIRISAFNATSVPSMDIMGSSGRDSISGTAGADTLSGAAGHDTISGGDGNDAINGGTGDDQISGDAGNDFLRGGAGNDSLNGGADFDYASYLDATLLAGVTVSLGQTTAQNTGSAGIDVLTDIEGIYGSQHADVLSGDAAAVNALYGNDGDDNIAGNGGFDYIEGGEGNDTIDGGAGDDYLIAGNGTDTLTYATAGAAVYVDMSGTSAFANGTASGFDVLSSFERIVGSDFGDYLFGSAGSDTLWGGAGIDIIYGFGLGDSLDGGSETDYLVGGIGADIITTGAGQDFVYFQGQAEGKDTITDWRNDGFDVLVIDEPSFGGGLTVGQYLSGAGNANRFVVGTAATAAQGQFLWNAATSTLSWDADGTGAGAAVQLVTLTGITALTAADILVL